MSLESHTSTPRSGGGLPYLELLGASPNAVFHPTPRRPVELDRLLPKLWAYSHGNEGAAPWLRSSKPH